MTAGVPANGRLLIDAVALERRIALIEKGRLSRLWIDRGGPARFDLHLGRVTKVLPEMAAAMVALDGLSDGLLPLDRYATPLHEGQWVLVQIARLGFEDKGVKLTGRIAIEGLGMILRPNGKLIEIPRKLKDEDRRTDLARQLKALQVDDDGIMLRSQALEWSEAALAGEYNLLRRHWLAAQAALADPKKPKLISAAQSDVDQMIERHLMAGGTCMVDGTSEFVRLRGLLKARGAPDGNLTRYAGSQLLFGASDPDIDLDIDLEDEINNAVASKVDLLGGGWIAIDPTTALCAIDVNAGGADAGRDAETRAIEVNNRAAREIVHQIRLRNIGGLIVIDPLRVKSRTGRDMFDSTLRKSFGAELDGAVQIGGFTRLGLYEFSRQRSGESLYERMQAKSDVRRLSAQTALNGVIRGVIAQCRSGVVGAMSLYVSPMMAQLLASDVNGTQILQNELGVAPEIIADPTLSEDAYRLEKKI